MTTEQFAYWLQGFIELSDETQPSEQQWLQIKYHLQQVFDKKTPEVKKETLKNPPIVTWPGQVAPVNPSPNLIPNYPFNPNTYTPQIIC